MVALRTSGRLMANDYQYKRVLLKISGEALMGSQAYGIDTAHGEALCGRD